jgi:hypothetical protein
MFEDVPVVVELRDGGPGVDDQTVSRIAVSSVGDGELFNSAPVRRARSSWR